MGNYLAFDLGASSGRAIIGSLENGILSLREVHRFGNGPIEKEGSFYWDYEALKNELITGIGKALALNIKLDSISIDTWGVDYVLFERGTKNMRRMPYNYRDTRTVKAAEELKKKLSNSELYAMTGSQSLPINTIYQLLAHKQEHPEDLENSVFLMMPDALALALGGDFTSEYTICSTSGMLDAEKRDWNWDLIDKIGLPRDIFPKIVPPCSKNGVLSKELCEKFNCAPIPLVKCASHDTASAVLAVPAPEKGEWAYLSAGTWALLGAELAAPNFSKEAESANITNEGGIGNTIRFLVNVMGSWLFQELRRNWQLKNPDISFNDMEQMARNSAQCACFINPYCADFAAPCNMPEVIRTFIARSGQGENLSDAEVVRAVYDSLALYLRSKLEGIENLLGVKYECLNIVGGGTKDRFLMQLICDALKRNVIAGPVEATSVGNILAQAIATGEIADTAAARKVVHNSFAPVCYTPDAASAARYDEVQSIFKKFAD